MNNYDFKDVLLSLNQKRMGAMDSSPVALHVVIVNRPAPRNGADAIRAACRMS